VTFGEAKTALERRTCPSSRLGYRILDISMPGKSGLDILSDLKRLRPKSPILLLSMHPEDNMPASAQGRRVCYLTKESVPEELKLAVKKIAAGGRYVSANLAERLHHDLGSGVDTPVHNSCPIANFNARMIASGKTVKQSPTISGLSVKTVSTLSRAHSGKKVCKRLRNSFATPFERNLWTKSGSGTAFRDCSNP